MDAQNLKNFGATKSHGTFSQRRIKGFVGNKRGSHVGVILSFLIFVTFMAFLYTAIAPAIKIRGDKQSVLNSLKIEIVENVSEYLTSITTIINPEVTENCLELRDFMDKTLVNSRLIVKNNSGNVFMTNFSRGNLFLDRGGSKTDFFKVYLSKEFREIGEKIIKPCKILKEGKEGYTIGSINVKKYLFETKIIELKNMYESNYTSLKRYFNISNINEFGFDFKYNNGTTIGTKSEDTQTSVYIEEMPVQYVDKEANILQGVMKIRVW